MLSRPFCPSLADVSIRSGTHTIPVRILFPVQHPEQRQQTTRERHMLAGPPEVSSRTVALAGERIDLVGLPVPVTRSAHVDG